MTRIVHILLRSKHKKVSNLAKNADDLFSENCDSMLASREIFYALQNVRNGIGNGFL